MSVETVKLPVAGMTCNGCVRTIERKLSTMPGVSKAAVDLAGASATVEYDPERTGPPELANAIRKLGYQVPQS
jgi:copper chaperone CopZ